MPPKTLFTREDVISSALDLVINSGFSDFSARRVADELKSSTAPVYSYFKSMDELKNEVLRRAEKIMLEYSTRTYTKSVFLNMGTGMVLFSQDYRELFRVMLLESGETRELMKNLLVELSADLDRDELVSVLPEKERQEVMRRMAIFTHGFASLICVGLIDDVSKNQVIKTMYNMGRDVISTALRKAGMSELIQED